MPALARDTRSVASLMSSPVLSLPASTTALEVLCLAEAHGAHHFPVYDEGHLIGVVCTCELEEIPLRAPIKKAIKRPPVSIDLDTQWIDAVRTMRAEHVGALLVLDEGRAVGVLTREDLTRGGFDSAGDQGFHCENCGAVTHLPRTAKKGVFCLDCRDLADLHTATDDSSFRRN